MSAVQSKQSPARMTPMGLRLGLALTLMLMSASLYGAWSTLNEAEILRTLPSTDATIIRVNQNIYGKSRTGMIAFALPGIDRPQCEVWTRLGRGPNTFTVGQTIKVVPVSKICERPIVDGPRDAIGFIVMAMLFAIISAALILDINKYSKGAAEQA